MGTESRRILNFGAIGSWQVSICGVCSLSVSVESWGLFTFGGYQISFRIFIFHLCKLLIGVVFLQVLKPCMAESRRVCWACGLLLNQYSRVLKLIKIVVNVSSTSIIGYCIELLGLKSILDRPLYHASSRFERKDSLFGFSGYYYITLSFTFSLVFDIMSLPAFMAHLNFRLKQKPLLHENSCNRNACE